jgi:hypothetical protein
MVGSCCGRLFTQPRIRGCMKSGPRVVLRYSSTHEKEIPYGSIPHDFPRWSTVYHYFRKWRIDGTWERLNRAILDNALGFA